MKAKSLILKVSLAAAACLLMASCSDFFDTDKPTTSRGSTPGNNSNKPQDGSLPGEFQKPNEGPFSEEKMLINIGVNVLSRSADNFAATVPVLKNSLRQYCEALSNGSSARREETQAQLDWERAMLAFHELEAAPFGPLLDDGRFLNDYIYSWPYLNTCDIDKKAYENSNTPISSDRLLFNVRGLSAIEYLLFEKSLKSTCNLRANPAMKEWNDRPASQKKLDRCLWAQELVKDVEVKSATLKSRWSVAEGNFTKALIDGSRYKSIKESINGLTDAMAHIEKLKDAKLGAPMARHKDCTEDKCPRTVEHLYSGLSLGSAEAQLKGFRAIFTGSFSNQPAYGLDDLLEKSGRSDVAAKVVAALDKAIASVQAAQDKGSLFDQIEAMDPALCKATTMTDRKEEICAVHADVREVAFLLKTEVLAALALRAPPTHQGDND
ncbi:imelysin family protein [Bdellovibrio bacteriovorus]|uniref:imelysin family protein n=1 Tax=Bdellovibrio bacteriovorus TaxID=959 RepID=UPI0021D1816F|nr:imelysin family protein [Bdellovibrio bacteriovorus]UXR64730.1 imelysin family protein [Bdellovibrio bacteriovorus]